MKQTEEPVVVEQVYDAPLNKVWKAITELDEMRKWYFENINSFEPRVGFETQFTIKNEDRIFVHLWKITGVEINLKISYEWRYEGYPGKAVSDFELFSLGEKTKLRLSLTVLEDFPDDVPEFRRQSCVDGWEYFLKDRLKLYLAKPKDTV